MPYMDVLPTVQLSKHCCSRGKQIPAAAEANNPNDPVTLQSLQKPNQTTLLRDVFMAEHI